MSSLNKDEFWAKLDALGDEEQVRQKVDVGDYGENKHKWAVAWLAKQDRQKLATKQTPWYKTLPGMIIIGVFIGLCVAYLSYRFGWR
ncbi:MAG: hypothetical protein O7D92_02500 [Proteobacteria bacterium]|nr:hypothetical protein [Pseudomonadota bacterium]